MNLSSRALTGKSRTSYRVRFAIENSARNKAAGTDKITVEMIQACGDVGVVLHGVFNTAWKMRSVPDDWQKAVIIPIWKRKGSKRDCSKYRGISLLSHAGKMYAKILETRIRPIVEPQLSEAQFGFRKNRGCTYAIFALRQLSETTISYDENLAMCFVDQEKAFDRVDRSLLWRVLEQYGVHGQLWHGIRAFIETVRARLERKMAKLTGSP